MRVAYGPPGHKGVTHLVAVGDTDPAADPANKGVMVVSALVAGAGTLLGNKTAVALGLGGVFALLGARWWRARRTVEVTTPATPTGGYR